MDVIKDKILKPRSPAKLCQRQKNFRRLIVVMLLIQITGTVSVIYGQDTEKNKTVISINHTDTLRADSNRIQEAAPLDIAENRGLFIVTPNGKMQLRILGSVRYLVVFDRLNMLSKNSFRTDEIPTGALNKRLPNYFNGLDQTRLGFEVTRSTGKGDVFIRLETDFAGKNGFRIRHAYGQYKKFLFGQTWSLFSHINALPSMVDFAGPTGSVIARNPQVRYTVPGFFKGANLAFGFEYSIPNLKIPDSLSATVFQLVPDFTIKIDKTLPWGLVQVSGVVPVLSGRSKNDQLIFKTGWGVSVSVVINSWKNGKWYFQGVTGRAITRYFNDLSGSGSDVVISSGNKIKTPLTSSIYSTYEHNWNSNLYSNLTFGWLHLQKYDFTEDYAYHSGYSLRTNTFWDITEGAKIGGEAIWGVRVDKDKQHGSTLRLNLLFYYDF